MSEFGHDPPPQELQFQHAEPLSSESAAASAQRCVVCKQPIGSTYYHAQGQVVCPMCAERIQSGQQAPPKLSLARAALWGAAAALAGCILYAAVAIVSGFEFGLIAIVIGVMVGKAIRRATYGRGGRPQQILAVLLTYFAITTSYIPVFIYQSVKHPEQVAHRQTVRNQDARQAPGIDATGRPRMGVASALVFILLLAAAAPFFSLGNGISGLISLFIIFIGVQQAWKLTARREILVMGPYQTAPAP